MEVEVGCDDDCEVVTTEADPGSAQALAKMILEAVAAAKECTSEQSVRDALVSKLQRYKKYVIKFGRRVDRKKHSTAYHETEPDGLCGYRSLYQAWLKHAGLPFKDPRLWVRGERDAFLSWLDARFNIALDDWSIRFGRTKSGKKHEQVKMLEVKKSQVVKFVLETKVGKMPATIPFMSPLTEGWFNESMCVAFRAVESSATKATTGDYFPLLRLRGDIDSAGYLWSAHSSWECLWEAISEHNYIHGGGGHFRLVEGDVEDTRFTVEALKILAGTILGVVSQKVGGFPLEYEALGRGLVTDGRSKSAVSPAVDDDDAEVVKVVKAVSANGAHRTSSTRSGSQQQLVTVSTESSRSTSTHSTASTSVDSMTNVNSVYNVDCVISIASTNNAKDAEL